ncbi:MAG: glycosyltransferase family 4 protein [Terriglobales bacterium]
MANDWLGLAALARHNRDRTLLHILHSDRDSAYELALRHDPAVDGFITHTRLIYDKLRGLLPHRLDTIFHLPYGVTIPPQTRTTGRGPIRLLFVARLEWAKGIYELPAIDEALRAHGVEPRWTIVGSGPDGETVRSRWCDSRVRWTGLLPNCEVLRLYQEHDVFVLPTRMEGFPVSLLEAMAAGMVPVITDLPGGIQQAVRPGVTGYLHPFSDVGGFAESIAHLHRDRARLEGTGMAARQTVQEEFDIRQRVSAYQDLFARWRDLRRPSSQRLAAPCGDRLDREWIPNSLVRTVRTIRRSAKAFGPSLRSGAVTVHGAGARRKRVLIYSSFLTVGGVETHIVNLCRLLTQNGAEVTVVSRIASQGVPALTELRRIPVQHLVAPFQGGRVSTLWAMAFWPLRLRRHFDVLYTFDLTWFTAFLARFVRPGGYVLGANWGPARPEEVRPAALKVLDAVLLETELQAGPYRDLLPAGAIPHLAQVSEAGRREPRRIEELRVSLLGRIIPQKGLYRLLDLWPSLDIQPARLDFYGDGPELNRLKSEIRARELKDVHTHGAFTRVDLPTIYAQTDMVVLPTNWPEGLPLVLLESMAYGVPFVATDVGAIRTLAQDNPDVCVVPLDDGALKLGIERMARAIRSGQIDGRRLQRYHRERYGYDLAAGRWLQALLHPEEFWNGGDESRQRSRRMENGFAGVIRRAGTGA